METATELGCDEEDAIRKRLGDMAKGKMAEGYKPLTVMRRRMPRPDAANQTAVQ
jgi:hypothetical protein